MSDNSLPYYIRNIVVIIHFIGILADKVVSAASLALLTGFSGLYSD